MRVKFIGFLLVLCVLVRKCRPTIASCSPNVDITDGILQGDHIIKDNISYGPRHYYDENGRTFGCICDVKDCVRKCCPLNKLLQERTCLDLEPESNFMAELNNRTLNESIDVYSFHIIDGLVDCGTKTTFKLEPTDQFRITPKGQLYWYTEYDQSNYCLDFYNSSSTFIAVICSEVQSEQLSHYSVGMIISMPFLVATFLVYALLPDRNLPAKALMCYVLSLLFAYIMLVTIQLNTNLPAGACNTIAFLCYFFFMASFFWMNSICIDIWLTFKGIEVMTGKRTQERKRFVYYCLYSWGLSLIMTITVIFVTFYPVKVDTGIGKGQCWFRDDLPTGIYFYFPIAALLITNITLFAVTALKIRNVRRDTKILNAKDSSKHEKDKQRFNLYVKLLFAMGINWSMEVISWAVLWKFNNSPTWIWYVTDFCNAMYGVLIFFIFVFKRNIWLTLKKRYLQIMERPTQAHSIGTSTHRTTVSQVTSSEA